MTTLAEKGSPTTLRVWLASYVATEVTSRRNPMAPKAASIRSNREW